jgi:hypothetical protein
MSEVLFRVERVGVVRRVLRRWIEGVDLAHQTLPTTFDHRKIVELWRVRELKMFQQCFHNYRSDLNL